MSSTESQARVFQMTPWAGQWKAHQRACGQCSLIQDIDCRALSQCWGLSVCRTMRSRLCPWPVGSQNYKLYVFIGGLGSFQLHKCIHRAPPNSLQGSWGWAFCRQKRIKFVQPGPDVPPGHCSLTPECLPFITGLSKGL